MSATILHHVSWEDAEQRLDRWMRRKYGGLVQSRIEGLCRKGLVRIDGKRARPSDRLKEGQEIRLPPIQDRNPDSEPCDVQGRHDAQRNRGSLAERLLHIDQHILAINKPPGLAVQGGTGQRRHIDRMALELGLPDGEMPKLVHRLDKDTSGVLLMARTRRASAALSKLFRHRNLRKVYLAAVCGSPPEERGSIFSSPKTGGVVQLRSGTKWKEPSVAEGALTHYAVLDRLGQRFTLVALNPVTGRTHQLRIHMAGLGTPIVGDRKFGRSAVANREGIFRNMLHLHARSMEIRHPFTGSELKFVAPLPPHMSESFSAIGWETDPRERGDPFTGPP